MLERVIRFTDKTFSGRFEALAFMYTAVTISLSLSSERTPTLPCHTQRSIWKDIKNENFQRQWNVRNFYRKRKWPSSFFFFLSWSMHFVIFLFFDPFCFTIEPRAPLLYYYYTPSQGSSPLRGRFLRAFFLRPIVSEDVPSPDCARWRRKRELRGTDRPRWCCRMFHKRDCRGVLRDRILVGKDVAREDYACKRPFWKDPGETITLLFARGIKKEAMREIRSKVGRWIIILSPLR